MKNDKWTALLSAGNVILLDGATGTQLALHGMPQGVCPELWCLENPRAITEIQQAYAAAGSRIVYAPTFGGNRIKLAEFGLEDRLVELNQALLAISRKAVGDDVLVFGDLAPTGMFVEPFGPLAFDEAVRVYAEQVKALADAGADGFVIETMMDIQEARAALLAVKETVGLPVMVSMTFDENGRTLTGSDPVSALITMQSMGADVFGCNCSTGPGQMVEVIRTLKPYATIPLLAKPNAGMPKLVDGHTVFDMSPEAFAGHVEAFVDAGVNVLGGCCGTSPDHIAACSRAGEGLKTRLPELRGSRVVSSAQSYHEIGGGRPLTIIGERINPTGKKALQKELRAGSLKLVKDYAREQEECGAHVLDVNMGLSGIDEKAMMLAAVKLLAQTTALPLCIDSADPDVVEAALRIYPGRALVNSVSAEKERLERTLPLVAKYGAMCVVLPLTDEGIPETVEARKSVVKTIFDAFEAESMSAADLLVDGLVMTVSSNPEAAAVTLDLIEWCSRDLHVNTVCGLSNVSFGMPERKWVNAAFLAMAVSRGLTSAIANPGVDILRFTAWATDALNGRDRHLQHYVGAFGGQKQSPDKAVAAVRSAREQVYDAVVQGDLDRIEPLLQQALEAPEETAKKLVDECLIPAIEQVGDLYDRKEYFLPQLIMSADTMRTGFALLEPMLIQTDAADEAVATVLLATVKGDIHDIGKNIVALMLKNYGFKVIDLGKDVPAAVIVEKAEELQVDLIGLSALMTTTMVNMKDVIAQLKARNLPIKVMVGGAVVDQPYADEIGADGYAADAMAAVRLARRLLPSPN